jgi:hypothetical protein
MNMERKCPIMSRPTAEEYFSDDTFECLIPCLLDLCEARYCKLRYGYPNEHCDLRFEKCIMKEGQLGSCKYGYCKLIEPRG